jgi:hypothetical protein
MSHCVGFRDHSKAFSRLLHGYATKLHDGRPVKAPRNMMKANRKRVKAASKRNKTADAISHEEEMKTDHLTSGTGLSDTSFA